MLKKGQKVWQVLVQSLTTWWFPPLPYVTLDDACTVFNYFLALAPSRWFMHLCRMLVCSFKWIYLPFDSPECPGGARSPCSGQGRCAEGMEGNGSCLCQVSSKQCSPPSWLCSLLTCCPSVNTHWVKTLRSSDVSGGGWGKCMHVTGWGALEQVS